MQISPSLPPLSPLYLYSRKRLSFPPPSRRGSMRIYFRPELIIFFRPSATPRCYVSPSHPPPRPMEAG